MLDESPEFLVVGPVLQAFFESRTGLFKFASVPSTERIQRFAPSRRFVRCPFDQNLENIAAHVAKSVGSHNVIC
jgi:hypothetical protein